MFPAQHKNVIYAETTYLAQISQSFSFCNVCHSSSHSWDLTGVQKLNEELEGDRILILQDHLLSSFQDFWREHLLKDRASTKEEILVDGEHLLMWVVTNVKTDYLRTHFTARRVRCNHVKTENDDLLADKTFRFAVGKDQVPNIRSQTLKMAPKLPTRCSRTAPSMRA